jgi:hypothetical protein
MEVLLAWLLVIWFGGKNPLDVPANPADVSMMDGGSGTPPPPDPPEHP